MAMRVKVDLGWLNDPADQASVANARLTLAVMELVQTLRHKLSLKEMSDLGGLFGPAFLACPEELRLAGGKLLRSTLEYSEEELGESLYPSEQFNEADFLDDRLAAEHSKVARFTEDLGDEGHDDDDLDFPCPLFEDHLPDDDTLLQAERTKLKQEKVARLIKGSQGHEWILDMLKKPTPASRKLFIAAARVIRRFIAKAVSLTTKKQPSNIMLLTHLLGLDASEIRFLELADNFQKTTLGRDALDFVRGYSEIRSTLNVLCNFDSRKRRGLLDKRNALRSSGLFEETYFDAHTDLGGWLRLSRLGETLLGERFESIEAMAQAVLQPFVSSSQIDLEWPHLKTESSLLVSVMRSALASKQPGINILLHGAPGTGKTEFARHLCTQLQCAAYAIATEDEEGNEANRNDRLASLQLSQRLAGDSSRAVLVLDEAEDIFQNHYDNPWAQLLGKCDSEGKGWTNQLLETNKHPVIWISNKINHLDPAYLRRFAYVMAFQTPPFAQRLTIAKQHLASSGASNELLQHLSKNTQLTPAMLHSAARFAALAYANGAGQNESDIHGPHNMTADDMVTHHINTQMKAHSLRDTGAVPELVTRFDTRYLNVKGQTPAEQVAAAMVRAMRGGAVFSGPPGTGKTQFAAHIAERANLELLYRTAADINSMWFGETERNVTKLFENCDTTRQMIFLDEADTLLMARTSDANRPERATTAEFLRRLEAFKGIFVCATNHSDILDPALMRRFVFRLSFLPLTSSQRTRMFAEVALNQAASIDDGPLPALDAATKYQLGKLDRLTAGDFANVKKRFTMLSKTATDQDWLSELEQEQAAKGERVNTPMGFVTPAHYSSIQTLYPHNTLR
jgi:SpoVK/Ycf46/Vps4 family AAA+-type ATPase